MSVIRVNKDDIENFTVVTTPRRAYSSSSLGSTGSIKIFPRMSKVEKSVFDFSSAAESDVQFYKDGSNFFDIYDLINSDCADERQNVSGSITDQLEDYFSSISSVSSRTSRNIDVNRLVPTVYTTKSTTLKNIIKDNLMTYYRSAYPHSHWAYTNYHALNFFTIANDSLTVPTKSVLLYPNIQDSNLPQQDGHVSGTYCLSGAFSFDFRINMRYQEDGLDAGHFKAGTIFHLSSSYALSVVTGSSKDARGKVDAFRLLLQLSQSADIPPSLAVQGSNPNDLIFLSNDNVLKHNSWHHVVVRWGTESFNQGTGSFVVDGVNAGYFIVPSGTINSKISSNKLPPAMLAVGNYYEGTNQSTSAQKLFFTQNASEMFGTSFLDDTNDQGFFPSQFNFTHPLKAEVHELSIKRYYVLDEEILKSGSVGPGAKSQDISKFAFYAPPLFTQLSPIRKAKSFGNLERGGVYQSSIKTISSTTDDPFNVAMAFGLNGHYINLENFTRDFTNTTYPRLVNLSGSIVSFQNNIYLPLNTELYAGGSWEGVPKRNLTILPCDDGSFDPSYELLYSEPYNDKYVNSNLLYDEVTGKSYYDREWSYISLDNLLSTASLIDTKQDPSSSFYANNLETLYGPHPDAPGIEPGPKLLKLYNDISSSIDKGELNFDRGIAKDGSYYPMFQNLRETSSNQITMFDVSDIFYGRRILPQTFVLKDTNLQGSDQAISITLKDDGFGNLYRADSKTPHATQNSVGNIFYDEGIILIKSPHLYFFGKNQYEMSFKGVKNIYTTKYEILAGSGLLNSSSNKSFAANKDQIKATGDATDKEGFVYISSINLHDENMNVLARVNLAQPIIKRFSDKILFKFTIDS